LSEHLSDDLLLECALSIYQQTVDSGYHLTSRPDRDKRNLPAVDGIFTAAASDPVAIEITELQTFQDQLKTRALFARYLKPIERDLARRLPRGIWCQLPTDPFVPGYDWSIFGELLSTYILRRSKSLPLGGTHHRIDGLPFAVSLGRDPKGWPLPFCFVRDNPPADQIRVDLLNHMLKALNHKREELRELQREGYRTALMLTSADCNYYCITWDLVYKVFLEAERRVGSSHVQDILFAFTGDYGTAYCMAFKSGTAFREALNSSTMKFGPEHADLWAEKVSA
jgi:hypothetical protein